MGYNVPLIRSRSLSEGELLLLTVRRPASTMEGDRLAILYAPAVSCDGWGVNRRTASPSRVPPAPSLELLLRRTRWRLSISPHFVRRSGPGQLASGKPPQGPGSTSPTRGRSPLFFFLFYFYSSIGQAFDRNLT